MSFEPSNQRFKNRSERQLSEAWEALSLRPRRTARGDVARIKPQRARARDNRLPSTVSKRDSRIDELCLLEDGGFFRTKRVLDYLFSTAAIVGLSPVLLFIALAIKLDSKGPVLFRQERHGLGKQVIEVWKFRTMKTVEPGRLCTQATRNDERITRIGAFLRKTSLDELPQFFNVLKGEMSVVGPRPHPIALDERYFNVLDGYEGRFAVKPGITGWAQINGCRGPTEVEGSMQRRLEFDLDYIERRSVWLDLRIIVATPFFGLLSKNAF